MEELKLSTRLLLVSGLVLLVILLTGPLGYRFELVSLASSFVSLLVALVGGWLLSLVGAAYLVIRVRRKDATGGGFTSNRNLLLGILVMGLIPSLFMVPQIITARSVPSIHDITTDTFDPPQFQAITGLRPDAQVYGASEDWPAEKLRQAQEGAYPDLQTLASDLSVQEAVKRAAEILSEMGLVIVAVTPAQGLVEATATSFWFGFKDDVVVRVQASGNESKIDLRSVSRIGQSDLGANAARIREFLRRFK